MVFSSIPFLFFLFPLFLLLYLVLPWKNLCILAFSLVFYAWGEGIFVLLLLATTFVNFGIGKAIAGGSARWALPLGVAINLGILAYFKYAAFLIDEVLALDVFGSGGPHLPLGISFFIFQSITYLVDLQRREARPARSFSDLALYIAMFPQLIAGPIVRYATVAEAIADRQIDGKDVRRGASYFVVGLACKTLIADNAAKVADAAFAVDLSTVDAMTAWLGGLTYTLQIYFDFAGYSLMAIGLGRIMGFRFPQNFDHPYVSRSITEFWRRWHISLSTWFRDYLYIPLGGNRMGPARTYLHLFIVFLLCGLWHGAAWTFVAWGMFHGLLLVVERVGMGRVLGSAPRWLAHAYTLTCVVVGWVLFRSETFAQAGMFLRAMVGLGPESQRHFSELVSHESLSFACLGVLFSMPVGRWLRERYGPSMPASAIGPARFAAICCLFVLCSIYILAGTYSPFIYFRF